MSQEFMNYAPDPDELMPGDDLIPEAQISWDTSVHVDREPEDVWNLLDRVGLQEEGGAGWYLPGRYEQVVPEKLHSVRTLEEALALPPREPGDQLKDFGKDAYATVTTVDHETRALAMESQLPKGTHYSWAVRVTEEEGGAEVRTRMRLDSIGPMARRVAPAIDQAGMRLVGEGLRERIPNAAGLYEVRDRTLVTRSLGALASFGTRVRQMR